MWGRDESKIFKEIHLTPKGRPIKEIHLTPKGRPILELRDLMQYSDTHDLRCAEPRCRT